ncbi:MAG: hypothetical protein L3J82_03035, partial [Planctomycetes bacterium]|nr:hypothetical protein [Planctomycetota bacterium]
PGFLGPGGQAGTGGASGGGGSGTTGNAGANGASSSVSGTDGNPGLGGFGGSDGTVSPSQGAGMGGALFMRGGVVYAANCTFSGNSVSASGGALALGGAIFNRNGNLTLLNCTFSGNTATDGGAVYNIGDGAISVVVVNNTIMADSIGNSDFYGNTINGGTNTTSGVGNLIESQVGFSGTIVTSADPGLGALADNGGATFTHAISAGSSALDSGDNLLAAALTTDQRGQARIYDSVIDIGSFELQGASAPPTNTNDGKDDDDEGCTVGNGGFGIFGYLGLIALVLWLALSNILRRKQRV